MFLIAKKEDLSLPEYVVLRQELASHATGSWAKKFWKKKGEAEEGLWEIPFTLFHSQMLNVTSVLHCSRGPDRLHEPLIQLYPHTLYRYWNPIQNGRLVTPFCMPDNAFDRVICMDTLETIDVEQRSVLIESLSRKLKPGGLMILIFKHFFEMERHRPDYARDGMTQMGPDRHLGKFGNLTPEECIDICKRQQLYPMTGEIEDIGKNNSALYGNGRHSAHTFIAGVFYKAFRSDPPHRKKIVLSLLTWNTRNISMDSVRAYIREARMLRRLGHDPIICVCDNGSTDGTSDALREIEPEIDVPYKFIMNHENLGCSVARNQIIDYMLGVGADYILMMDGDVEVVPFSSYAMLRYMENNGDQVGCVGILGPRSDTIYREKATPCLYNVDPRLIKEINSIAFTWYGLFRRKIFEDGVRLDEAEPLKGVGWGCEDQDMAFQMTVKKYRIHGFTGMTFLHRARHSSVSIMKAQGIDAKDLYFKRKQYIIDKWSSVPEIKNGPLIGFSRKVNISFMSKK
jgi:glycosyl transferase family 2/methyltransferase family protein